MAKLSNMTTRIQFSMECCRCGKILATKKGEDWYSTPDLAERAAGDAEWREIEGNYYCPDCCHYDRQRGRYVVNGREDAFMQGDIVYLMYENEIREAEYISRDDNGYLNLRISCGLYLRRREKEIFRSAESLAQYLVFGAKQKSRI